MKKLFYALLAFATLAGCQPMADPTPDAVLLQKTVIQASDSNHETISHIDEASAALTGSATQPSRVNDAQAALGKAHASAQTTDSTLKVATKTAGAVVIETKNLNAYATKVTAQNQKYKDAWLSPKMKLMTILLSIVIAVSGGAYVYFKYFTPAGTFLSYIPALFRPKEEPLVDDRSH